MKTSIIKKAVSVLACVSILAGCAAMSNAAGGTGDPPHWFDLHTETVERSVVSKKSKEIFTYKNTKFSHYVYKYSVSYVHFSGCATGAYMPGLKVRVSGQNISDVNTSKRWGPYIAPTPSNQFFTLYNGAKKDVGIKMVFGVSEYW